MLIKLDKSSRLKITFEQWTQSLIISWAHAPASCWGGVQTSLGRVPGRAAGDSGLVLCAAQGPARGSGAADGAGRLEGVLTPARGCSPALRRFLPSTLSRHHDNAIPR